MSHAAGTCQHCLWPGEQRRDSFQGVLFPYPLIIYLPGHKSVFPCSCKASAYRSSVFRKVYSFALPALIYSVDHFKKIKKPIYFTIKSPLLNSQVLHRSSAWSVVPVSILYFTGTWSHTATQLCPVGASGTLLTATCTWVALPFPCGPMKLSKRWLIQDYIREGGCLHSNAREFLLDTVNACG